MVGRGVYWGTGKLLKKTGKVLIYGVSLTDTIAIMGVVES